MTLPAGRNRWGSIALGVVCLGLVGNLVVQFRGLAPGHSKAKAAPASAPVSRSEKDSAHAVEDLAKYDPAVRFEALKQLDSRPLPDEDRNPFEDAGGMASPLTMASAPAGAPIAPAGPPPPPPIPLKAVGYNDMPGGKKQAMITNNDELVMAYEGDVIAGKYKVLKIDPSMVLIEDSETHKTVELPYQP
jgi:hypothetical protein